MSIAVTIERHVAHLKLDRPPLNILTREMLGDVHRQLGRLADDVDVRVLLISAAGKHFSAGADVGEHLPPHHLSLIPEFLDTLAALDAFPLPTLAAVQGRCLGGGFELVQPLDLIVAAESATFGQPEIALGVFPPGACVLLPERLPRTLAAQLIFGGEPIGAFAAEHHGLVARVVPDAELESAAGALAERLARNSGAALRAAKRALRGDNPGRRSAALRQAGHIYLHELMETHDAVEGLRAFVEKRSPAWRDQ